MFTLTVFAVDGELEQEPKEEIQKFMDVDVSYSEDVVFEITSTSTDAELQLRQHLLFMQNAPSKLNVSLNSEDTNKRFSCNLNNYGKSKVFKHNNSIFYPTDVGWLISW